MKGEIEPRDIPRRQKDSHVEWAMESLSYDTFEKIDQIAIKHNVPEMLMLDSIRAWFGDDMLEAYLDWRAEGDV